VSLSDDARIPAELDTQILERTAQLKKQHKELEAFAYSLCPDLTAPLLQIQGYLELLTKHFGTHPDPVAQNYLPKTQLCAERMSRLMQDLLRLSGLSRASLSCRPIDLTRMANETVSNLSNRAPSRRVEWLIANDLQAEGDPGLVEILPNNLFSNAWKYTANCPVARIEFGACREVGGPAAYYVRDNGAGFDMASVERLFRPFERLHDPSEFPGLGVGLATARRIVERHGGRIWGEGAVGRGAVFRFTLAPRSISSTGECRPLR
jgi:light-regulated signal transduction histidine kinase (bacteriophytochrome)